MNCDECWGHSLARVRHSSISAHRCPHQLDNGEAARPEPALQPVCWAVKRQERTELVWSGVKASGKAGGRGSLNSLYFSCNFSVSLKLCQNKELKQTGPCPEARERGEM